jgi:hypothetical protein
MFLRYFLHFSISPLAIASFQPLAFLIAIDFSASPPASIRRDDATLPADIHFDDYAITPPLQIGH